MDPYVGEIRTVGFSYAPTGWALCSGQLVPISQNTALFSLLGTNYGGDGKTTFALPNLNGTIPIGQGEGPGLTPRTIGEQGGTTAVSLISTEMPSHRHAANAVAAAGDSSDPEQRVWAQQRYGRGTRKVYAAASNTLMAPESLAMAGSSAGHNNMPPYLGMYYIICLRGIFPPRP
ncbi:phage tail protein [Streptomyces sp. AC495_CC817]|uniref:phage tail protein n=1 Tax=Streptomyces sp. AC495_CC817 TaxID=2823900 RepID=UPI001C280E1E|nr:tail fiber protein [Streptomyces sp. AC495_CC817]